jgi:carbamoyltransferase
MSVVVLGINHNNHDSAASLLIDGRVAAVAEEERFLRKKHAGDIPVHAARFCLERTGLKPGDIDHVAFFYDPFLVMRKRISLFVRYFPSSLNLLVDMTAPAAHILSMFLGEARLLKRKLFANDPSCRYQFHYVEHHQGHAASAFMLSPFERAAILSLDGTGEWATTWLGRGEGNRLEFIRQMSFPHSVGLVYSAVTEYLGFKPWSGEGKVMGLAAYGDPGRYLETFRRIIHPTDDGGFAVDMSYFRYHVRFWREWVSQKFIDVFGPRREPESAMEQRHQDIAAALQAVTEEIGIHIANHLQERTGEKNLCLAGGVALNCVMNGRILRESRFTDVFVQPMANDAGTSLGAALYVYHVKLGHPRVAPLRDIYLGPEFASEDFEKALQRHPVRWHRSEDPAREVARLLADGKIIGWFQGRMEVGPRALGNRSILADPRRPEMKDVINARVKHREGFRPFAPSVLEEKAGEYFERSYTSPYMILNFEVRPEKRDVIPSVTHVDGTARVQTVARAVNPLYYRLIEEFEGLTGVPVLLNTSFNVRGEPIVYTPEDAIRCFLATDMDRLVLGDHIVEKRPQA